MSSHARDWGAADFSYDAIGRLLSRVWLDADPINAGAPRYMRDEWQYDAPFKGALARTSRARLASAGGSATNLVGEVEGIERRFSYYALVRPAREEVSLTRPDGQVDLLAYEYAYDAGYGRLKAKVLPGLETVYFTYSQTGHLKEQGDARLFAGYGPNNGYYERIEAINAQGATTLAALRGPGLGAGFTRNDVFDPVTGLMTSTSQGGVLGLSYRYDAYGNVTEQRDALALASASKERYTYDPLQRLSSSSRYAGNVLLESTEYSYDPAGNFRKKTDFSSGAQDAYSYASATSYRVQSVALAGTGGTASYQYDDNGNVVRRTTSVAGLSLRLGYDIDNHPLAIKQLNGDGAVRENGSTFRYGPDGQRYAQTINRPGEPVRTLLYLDKSYEKEIAGSGVIERWYLPGNALKVRSTDPAVPSGLYFIHADRLNSTSAMTDTSGQVIDAERRSFDPFGRPRLATNWNQTESPTALNGPRNRRGFTQHEHVDRTNLVHMNGRVFDVELGRFYGVDPLVGDAELSQALNPYSYIYNNPLSGADPTGYSAVQDRLWSMASGGSALPAGLGIARASGNGAGSGNGPVPVCFGKAWECFSFGGTAKRLETIPVEGVISEAMREQWAREDWAEEIQRQRIKQFEDARWLEFNRRDSARFLTVAGGAGLQGGFCALTFGGCLALGNASGFYNLYKRNYGWAALDFGLTAAGGALGRAPVSAPAPVVTGPSVRYSRSLYGGSQTTNEAANSLRVANEGMPCPTCGTTQVRGTPVAPSPQHSPSLVRHYHDHGGYKMTDAQRRAYATSTEAFDGTQCLRCQRVEGAAEARYSRKKNEELGL